MSVSRINEIRPYLTFILSGRLFAVDVAKVRDVLDYSTMSVMISAPGYLIGKINLRRTILPVIDLRIKYKMKSAEPDDDACILVLETRIDGKTITAGVLADSIQEVFELEPDQIYPLSENGQNYFAEFLLGMGKKDEKQIMVIDTEKILLPEELTDILKSINPENIQKEN